MDTNHDGYLDKDEIRAALTARFQRMDRNGDGVLTPDERVGQRGASMEDSVEGRALRVAVICPPQRSSLDPVAPRSAIRSAACASPA
jgi:hypothetical protein